MNQIAKRLISIGMSSSAAADKADLFERASRALPRKSKGGKEITAYFVPGRIEVLGKHTDYAGGRSIVCTAERGFCLVARSRADAGLHIVDARSQETCMLSLTSGEETTTRPWCRYPLAVVQRVARNFPEARRGADISFASDLPQAAGMSSSSALIVAFFLALSDINTLSESPAYRRNIQCLEELAGYLGTVENGQNFGTLAGDRGVGTFGGSEDHTAILCSSSGKLKQYSFCPIRHERTLAFPDGYVFSIAVSGVVAMKTGAARENYNRAALSARRIADIWRAATGCNDDTLAAALTHSPDAPERMRDILRAAPDPVFPPNVLRDRFEQFLLESNMIIPSASEALDTLDLQKFGTLSDLSQREAETRLGNQVPETIALVRSARSLGAVAASAFGAGFGGSVWALVPASDAAEFLSQWAAAYQNRFPNAVPAQFFTSLPGPPAHRL